MITTVSVFINYSSSVNKLAYNGFKLIVITFYCRKLEVSATTDLR
jgi:hypothetical protein